MKRFTCLISIVICLSICFSMAGCGSVDTDELNANRSTVALDDVYSSINGEKVVNGISSNDASNTSTVIVTVQSDNGEFPCYVLGKVVGGKGALTDPGNDTSNGNGDGTTTNPITIDPKDRGLSFLLLCSVSCPEAKPAANSLYDLYFDAGDGDIQKANSANLPKLLDGDEIQVGGYTFKYSQKNDQWLCTETPESANSKFYHKTDVWTPISIVSKELKGKASEGCQWQMFSVLDQGDEGKLGFVCIDVTAPYKSTDGGKTWKPSNLGWGANGSQCVAIDPKNPNHVLGAGCGSTSKATAVKNGVYYSEDAGESWEHVFLAVIGSYRTYSNQFAFDETSYDASKNMCTTVYWSREDNESNQQNDPALYKSTDGGRNWEVVNKEFGGCHLEMTTDGTLYALPMPSNMEGSNNYPNSKVYKSTDGGKTFKQLDIKLVRTIDTIRSKPNNLYVGTTSGFYLSTDKGETFNKISDDSYKGSSQCLAVANNGLNMSVQDSPKTTGGRNSLYSTDGGKTWKSSDMSGVMATAFMPINARVSPRCYSGSNNNRIIAIYGDTTIGSDDGGKSWVTSNLGLNVICTDRFIFNINNEKLMLVPAQDYCGAFSTDGGETFKFLSWPSDNAVAGHAYGGYILDEKTMFTCWTSEWLSFLKPRFVYTTHDGGKTFNRSKDYPISTEADIVSMGAIGNDKIGFVGNMRTDDGAHTFKSMENIVNKNGEKVDGGMVLGVWCVDYKTGRLYGRDNKSCLVYSDDNGASWKEFASYSPVAKFQGVTCCEDGTVYAYVIIDSVAYFYKTSVESGKMVSIPAPFSNKQWEGCIWADYYYPEIIYAVTTGPTFPKNQDDPFIWRTENTGKNWVALDRSSQGGNPICKVSPNNAPTNVVIKYSTNEVFVNFSCQGIWKIGRVTH